MSGHCSMCVWEYSERAAWICFVCVWWPAHWEAPHSSDAYKAPHFSCKGFSSPQCPLSVSAFSLIRSCCNLKEVPAKTIQGQPVGFWNISASTCEWGKSETSGLSLQALRLSFSLIRGYSWVSAKSPVREWVRGMEAIVIQPGCKLRWCFLLLPKVPNLQGQGSYKEIFMGNKYSILA